MFCIMTETNKIKEEELVRKLKDSFPDMLDFNNCLKELREFWKQQATADFIKMIESKELLEKLSDLEHEQWMHWSKSIVNNERISEDRMDKFAGLWINYSKLKEEDKEKDRKFARLVIKELKQMLVGK